MTPEQVLQTARTAFKLGLCVVPPREDGTKMPMTERVTREQLHELIGAERADAIMNGAPRKRTWKHWQYIRPDADQLRRWFTAHRAGIGLITGSISKYLELLEFDNPETYQLFRDMAESLDLDSVIDRIEAGYRERTPGSGIHWLYYCDVIEGNQKLARRPGPLDEDGNPTVETLIETKGEGGYVVIAPSHGPVHETGQPYELISGGLEHITTITPDERASLLTLARALDEMPKPQYDPVVVNERKIDGKRPGDIYNEIGPPWPDILTPHGWRFVFQSGKTEFWRRPGKDRGWSATINGAGIGADRLYIFSSSTVFPESERSYSKWQAYAILEHGGDFHAAAQALVERGYVEDNTPAQLIRKSDEAKEDPNLTDVGNAQRFVAQHRSKIRYVHAWKRWLVWDGRRWRQDDSGEIYRLALATIRQMYAEAAEIDDAKERKRLGQHAIRSESKQRIESMVGLAENLVPVRPDDLDTDPMSFNVLNGTIDLRTGKRRPHNPDDLITKIAPIEHDPRARCPNFRQFLTDVLDDDEELEDFVQRLAGYSLTADTREQIVTFAYGTGQNGKTTLLNVLLELLGEYGMQTPTETLLVRRTDGIPNDIARLRGARLVAATEVEENRRLSEALVKQLTGGDRISARFMRGEWFDFTPSFKIFLATNHKPVIRGTDHAIWRRIRLIPFTVTIPDDQKDPDLPKKLKRELPGILNWALQGCLAWQSDGLPMPERVETATSAYRSEMDVLSDWLSDRCVIEEDAECYAGELYQSYKNWCEAVGEKPRSQKWLGLRLGERGFQSIKGSKGKRRWLGITVQSSDGIHQSSSLMRSSLN